MFSETYKAFNLIIRSQNLKLKYIDKVLDQNNYDLLIKEDLNLNLNNHKVDLKSNDFLITENGVIVLIKDVGIFRIFDGKLITWKKENENVTDDDLITFILGSIFSICLIQRGLLVLHANALEKNGNSVICLGESGVGKSTLAFILMNQGWNLLADDLVAINDDNFILPGVSRIKLWENTLKDLAVPTTNLEKVRPNIDKYVIPKSALRKAQKPVKINAIYIIERNFNCDDYKLKIENVKTQKMGYLLLREQIYRPYFMRNLGLEGKYFKKLISFQKFYSVKILKLPNSILETVKQLENIAL